MDYAKRGARVILACRDMTKANAAQCSIVAETGNANVIAKLVDFESLQSIRQFAANILDTEQSLHILVNNAGAYGPPQGLTADGLQRGMQINYFGHFLLTQLLLGN